MPLPRRHQRGANGRNGTANGMGNGRHGATATDAKAAGREGRHQRDGGRRRDGDGRVNFGLLLGLTAALIACAVVAMWLVSTDFRPFDAVAATASDGYRLYEDDVTGEVARRRAMFGLDDDGDWADWLSRHGYADVTSVRKAVINDMMWKHALESECDRIGVTPSDDDIDAAVRNYRGTSGMDDDAWETVLAKRGYDDASYRDQVATSLMVTRLKDALTTDDGDGGLSSDTVIGYVESSGSYFQHARKVTCIVMRADEREQADEAAGRLQVDPSLFDELRSEHGETDMLDGWDVLNDFTSSISDTLDALGKGDVSGVIEVDSSNLLVIARIDDAFDTDEQITSLSQLPQDLVQAVKDSLSDSGRTSAVYSHLDDVLSGLDVKVSDTDVTRLAYYVDVPASTGADGANANEGNESAGATDVGSGTDASGTTGGSAGADGSDAIGTSGGASATTGDTQGAAGGNPQNGGDAAHGATGAQDGAE